MKINLPEKIRYWLGTLLLPAAISPQVIFALQDPATAVKVQDLLATLGLGWVPVGLVQAVMVAAGGYLLKQTPPEAKFLKKR